MDTSSVVLIFGGEGFIGNHLARLLESRGNSVITADLKMRKTSNHENFVYCDIRQPINIVLQKKPTIVINLAAIHRTPGHLDNEYYETNVLGSLNIARWCSSNSIKHIIFTSSISVYGPGEEIKSERSVLAPISAYGRSKLLAEEIFLLWQSEDSSRKIHICRPAVIFGKGEGGNFSRLARALRKRTFFYPGRKNTIKASGYVKDLASAILFVSEKGKQIELYNFTFKKLYTIEEICLSFNRIAGFKEPRNLPISKSASLLTRFPGYLGMLGQRISKLSHSTIVTPDRLNSLGFRWKFDMDSALLDWDNEGEKEHKFV